MTLGEAIKRKGYKDAFVAQSIGISPWNFSNKKRGKTRFSSRELVNLKNLLDLNDSEFYECFFGSKNFEYP